MKTICCHTSHIQTVDSVQICTNGACDNYLGRTECEKDYSKSRRILATGLFIISILFSVDDFSKADHKVEADLVSVSKSASMPVSIANIEAELKAHDVICYKEVIAQIKLESGNLSSYLMKKTNNMLGMRYPVKRETTAIGLYLPESDTIITGTRDELKAYAGKNNYAVYNTWQEAVADYALWQKSSFKVHEKYLEFLGNVYAEDPLYTAKIIKIASQIK